MEWSLEMDNDIVAIKMNLISPVNAVIYEHHNFFFPFYLEHLHHGNWER